MRTFDEGQISAQTATSANRSICPFAEPPANDRKLRIAVVHSSSSCGSVPKRSPTQARDWASTLEMRLPQLPELLIVSSNM